VSLFMREKPLRRVKAAIIILAAAVLVLSQLPSPAYSSGATFYVDCAAGNDASDGMSVEHAWKSLRKANTAKLQAGGYLLLKRGCMWQGPLLASWTGSADTPVTIGTYGDGEMPLIIGADPQGNVVKITGSYLVLQGLQATAAPPEGDARCDDQPVGWRVGFAFADGGHNTVRDSKAFGLTVGAHLAGGTSHNRILNSRFEDNSVLSQNTRGGDDDSGAWGVLINGDDNEVAWNSFTGNRAKCSYDYGSGEGASIEIYGAQRNQIHHNFSVNDKTFTELGIGSAGESNHNTFAYNIYVNTIDDYSEFFNLRGEGNKVYNNSGYQTGDSSRALVAPGDRSTVVKNNILWSDGSAAFASGPIAESHNIYWASDGRPEISFSGFDVSPTSRVENPRFEGAPSNLHLRHDSPAVNAGTIEAVQAGYARDMDHTPVPIEGAPDIGAYELGCEYTLGFRAIHELIPGIVGHCINSETHNPQNGDALQTTANGLLVWRKADNWTAFTDGTTTWVNGPQGLQSRPNDQRFDWEAQGFVQDDIPQVAGNLIENGSFEAVDDSWFNPWIFRQDVSATIVQDTNESAVGEHSLQVVVRDTSPSSWLVQVRQENRALEAGRTYRVTFWAKASVSRAIEVKLQKATAPYESHCTWTANLTTSWQQHSETCTVALSDANSFVAFNLATATGQVWLDGVALTLLP
jgi:hypothetical protein